MGKRQAAAKSKHSDEFIFIRRKNFKAKKGLIIHAVDLMLQPLITRNIGRLIEYLQCSLKETAEGWHWFELLL